MSHCDQIVIHCFEGATHCRYHITLYQSVMTVQNDHLFTNWTTRKQIGNDPTTMSQLSHTDTFSVVSWSLILSVAATHSLVPLVRPYTTRFYDLPYAQGNGLYVQGSDDALFVLGWLVLLTAIRATIIECLYEFVTRLRVMSRKASMRFAEQGFLLIYDSTSFSMGMVRVHSFTCIESILTVHF